MHARVLRILRAAVPERAAEDQLTPIGRSAHVFLVAQVCFAVWTGDESYKADLPNQQTGAFPLRTFSAGNGIRIKLRAAMTPSGVTLFAVQSCKQEAVTAPATPEGTKSVLARTTVGIDPIQPDMELVSVLFSRLCNVVAPRPIATPDMLGVGRGSRFWWAMGLFLDTKSAGRLTLTCSEAQRCSTSSYGIWAASCSRMALATGSESPFHVCRRHTMENLARQRRLLAEAQRMAALQQRERLEREAQRRRMHEQRMRMEHFPAGRAFHMPPDDPNWPRPPLSFLG